MDKLTSSKFKLLETLDAFGIFDFNYNTMWDPMMNEGRGGVFFLVLMKDRYIRFNN